MYEKALETVPALVEKERIAIKKETEEKLPLLEEPENPLKTV